MTDESRPDPLEDFVRDFFMPIARDGVIDPLEEPPLVVAFHAYGIGALLREDEAAVRARLGAALREACAEGRARRPNVREVWARLQRAAPALTRNDYHNVRRWLGREAARLGQWDLEPEPEPENFAADSIDRECLGLLGRMLDELRAAIEAETPAEASATPAAEETTTAAPPPAAPIPAEPPAPAADVVERESPLTADDLAEALEALNAAANEILDGMEALLAAGDGLPGLAFDGCRAGPDDRVLFATEAALPSRNLWFVGDVHGDFLALEAVLGAIAAHPAEEPPTVVFLGDLIDDGPHSREVLLRIFRLALDNPGRD